MGYIEDEFEPNPYAAPREAYEPPAKVGPFTGYGGFWLRFVAFWIDAFIVSGIRLVLIASRRALVLSAEPEVAAAVGVFYGLLGLALYYGYYAALISSPRQATIGKMLMGLKVTDVRGRRISFARAVGRELAKLLSYFTLLIGFIMAAFTDRKQALHDMIAGTLVVRIPPAERWPTEAEL